jgi:hypothetical protein
MVSSPYLALLGSMFARSIVFPGCAVMLILITAAQAQDDSARRILKSMSDYVASQKIISLTFDTDIEVITPDIQKIQFSSSGQVLLSRPDKVRATRTGGYADVELVFDGKTATIFGKNVNAFTQVDSPGSIDALIDRLRTDYSVEMPGADLLLTRVYDELIVDVIDAKHIGQGVIDGVECEHLAFRNAEVDWQLWVEAGARPIPRKYVITSKSVTGAPQYTVHIKQWSSDAPASADAFVFKAPADAKKVEPAASREIDEVPPGIIIGGRK